jgi:hypothetical protein
MIDPQPHPETDEKSDSPVRSYAESNRALAAAFESYVSVRGFRKAAAERPDDGGQVQVLEKMAQEALMPGRKS